MKTCIDVIDTAVKIGLGAFIAGGTSYIITCLSHKNEREKEHRSTRNVLLQQVAEQVEVFTHAFLRRWALTVEYARYTERGQTHPPDLKGRIEDERNTLFDAYKELTNAEAKLLLLGFENAQAKLRECGEIGTRTFRKKLEFISEANLEEEHSAFLICRKEFFDLLSKEFNS